MQVCLRPPSIHEAFHIGCFEAKGQLTKANQTKVKMENLARELQKVSTNIAPQVTQTNLCPGQQETKGASRNHSSCAALDPQLAGGWQTPRPLGGRGTGRGNDHLVTPLSPSRLLTLCIQRSSR